MTVRAECGQMGCSGCKYEALVTGEGQLGRKERSGPSRRGRARARTCVRAPRKVSSLIPVIP